MAKVDTNRGPVDEELLVKRETERDDDVLFGTVVDYFHADGTPAAQYLRGGFMKRNEFRNDPMTGPIEIEVDGVRKIVDASELVRRVGCDEGDNDWACWAEYRFPGSDVIVKRPVHVYIKRGAAADGAAGSVG